MTKLLKGGVLLSQSKWRIYVPSFAEWPQWQTSISGSQMFKTHFFDALLLEAIASIASMSRLLHSPSLVAIGLSVGYETWPPIGWHHAFVIGWSKYRLGLPSAPFHYGLTWPMGISTVFQTPVTVPLHSPNDRQMPAVRPVQWDCEMVYSMREQFYSVQNHFNK